jgi:hypothetical protein
MAEPQQILKDRVIELERTVPEIYKQLGMMDTRTDMIARNAEEVRRAIYGFNGTAGILHKVHTLEEKMSDIKKLVWAILVIVLGIAIEGIYLAVQHVLAAP